MSITIETNYILVVVAIVTVLALVSFHRKPNIRICNLQSETKGPAWNRHSSDVVLTPISRLCGVDRSWLRQKLGTSVFMNTPVAKLLPWQQQ